MAGRSIAAVALVAALGAGAGVWLTHAGPGVSLSIFVESVE